MATIEKLFVQIFERKNSIIDQVKHQSDLFDQYLISKCLISGINPPSWLLNAGTETGTTDLTELKKQDLIFDLLNPQLRSTVPSISDHCTFYSKPDAKSYNGPTSDSLCMETCASNKYFEAGSRLTVVPKCHVNKNELSQNCMLNRVCELSPTIASRQGQTSVMEPDNYFEPVESLARIQRSRSRQKTLELRNSARANVERPSRKKGNCSVYSGRIMRSRTACRQPNTIKELLELNKACDYTDDNGGGGAQTKTAKCPSSGNDLKEASSRQVDIIPCSDASGIGNQEKWNPDIAETASGQAEACPFLNVTLTKKTVVAKCHVNKNELLENCTSNGICELSPTIASPQGQTSVREPDNYFEPVQSLARIQRSKSRQKALELRNSASAKAESPSRKKGNSSVYSGRVTRSRTACQQLNTVKELLELNKASDNTDDNGGGAAQTKTVKCPSSGNDLKEASGWQVNIFPCSDSSGIGNQEKWNADIAETTNGQAEACPFLHLNCARGSSQFSNPKIASGGVKCSNSASTEKPCQLAEPLNSVGGGNLQKSSEAQVDIPPCNDVPRIVNEENDLVGTKEHDCVPTQPCSIGSQSNMHGASLRDGMEFLLKRQPSESGTLLEPKQLVFDDAEEFNLNESIDPMEKGTQGTSLEMRSFSSLGPAEFLEKVEISNLFHKKCDTSMDELQMQKELAKEVVNRENEAHRAYSYSEANAEGGNEFIVEKSRCDYYTVSVAKSSKWPAVLSKNATSKICKDAVPDKSPEIHKTSNQILCLTDDLITRQVGEQSSAERQPQKVVDSCLTGVDMDPQADISGKRCNEDLDIGSGKIFPEDCELVKDIHYSGDKCNEELDPGKIFPEDCERGKDAYIGPKKATKIDFTCIAGSNFCRESAMLLRSQETKVSCVPEKDATRSFQDPMAAADSPKMGSAEREPPYYLRSSNSRDKNVGSSKLSGSTVAKKTIVSTKTMKNPVECSWPHSKRRKLEGRSSNAFTASGILRRGKPLQEQIHEETEYRPLKNVENGAEAVLEVQHFASFEMNVAQPNHVESLDVQMHEKESFQKVEGLESPTKLQVKEGELAWEGGDQSVETTFTCNDKHVESSLDYSLRNEVNGYLKSSFSDSMVMEKEPSVAFNLTKESTVEDQNLVPCESNLNLESTRNLSCTNGTMLETHLEDHGSLSYCLVSSPLTKDVDLISDDQTMPGFEGLGIGEPTDKDLLCIAENGSGLDHSDLLSTLNGQDNILEQLYRSSSVLTPLPLASTEYNVHRTPDIFQSLPNGLLEHMNLRNSLLFNADESKQVKCSYNGMGEEVDCTFLGRSYSDCMSSPSVRFSWDVSRPPCTPPVGKLRGRITVKASNDSLEKQESINQEYTCFRIEEDSCICEENGDTDEMVDPVKEGIQSRGKNCLTKKEPLADVTNGYLNPSASVSLADKSVERGSLDSVNAGFNTSQTQMDAKQKLKSGYGTQKKYKNKEKDKCFSLGGSGSWKVTESLQTRFRKPKLSGKVTEGKGGENLLERGNKRNNIVSNISSFIPFVKQKQPAGAVIGKRDVKVKSLEAAEAARRLEEKRENERKMKKEAVKLERARLEQENMRQLQLKQKKKEEERKKKEADLAGRKRLREEEERKEKERKRKWIEEARRQQREYDERLRVEKEEKEIRRRAAVERERKEDERADEARKLPKLGKSREGSDCRKKTDTELRAAMVSGCDAKEASDFHQDCQAPKNSDEIEKEICELYRPHEDAISVTEGSLEQSYAISPYQGSDDEEEEEDDMPNHKFIPSWASENCLASIMPALNKVDPDGIFSLSSCCSIAEVLLPQKQQLRRRVNLHFVDMSVMATSWLQVAKYEMNR
ncbi:hypothetical protein NE237_033242 [Protea cynaroides]|uniref:Inner centromere protein ARK-binding domain-containing protein n=1 Tax=Protea cynaroides TaxID=273540 RepID=A0A9Q0R3V4_9MAGN|nr:hypothetical protein NE237_033242 [Protea cynaroides]